MFTSMTNKSTTEFISQLVSELVQYMNIEYWIAKNSPPGGLRRSERNRERYRANNYVDAFNSPVASPSSPPSKGPGEHSTPPTSPSRSRSRSRSGSSGSGRGVVSGRIGKKWRSNIKTTTGRGLHNWGNDCYRNSTLQCLFHLPEFVSYLNSIHAQRCPKSERRCVVCALKTLVHKYWFEEATQPPPKGPSAALLTLNQAIKATIPEGDMMYEDIVEGKQADPYDFLLYLYAELQEIEQESDQSKPADLFDIGYKTQWTCEKCGNTETWEGSSASAGLGIGVDVSIHLPRRGSTLLRYLRRNVYDVFDPSIPTRCESAECIARYGDKHEGFPRRKRRFITKAPEILVVKLVPYNGDQKVLGGVKFSEYLNLGEFTESGDPLLYKIQGVVAHSGKDLKSGHYIAAARQHNGKTFYTINDDALIAKERDGTVVELEYPSSRKQDFDPYLLFYSKLQLPS